jgi:3-hydroxyisobutyrate dehydrogenase
MGDPSSERVAVIGLGAMGMGTAKALLDAGFSVTGCDVSPAALEQFADAGGKTAYTPAEAARGARFVLLIVVNASQVEQVMFGDRGLAYAALGDDAVVLQNATIPPAFAVSLPDRLPDGVEILDAPISGGAIKAREGALSVIASGAPVAFERAQPVLEAMAATVHRLGDHCGPGSSVKLVNQLLAGVHIAAAAEAMALGIRMGLDAETIYNVVTSSAGNSWMFENRMAHVLAGDYSPRSAVEIFVKDMGIVTGTGHDLHFPLPLSAAAQQQFNAASAAGFGREDDCAVIKVYERLAGISLPSAANDGATA